MVVIVIEIIVRKLFEVSWQATIIILIVVVITIVIIINDDSSSFAGNSSEVLGEQRVPALQQTRHLPPVQQRGWDWGRKIVIDVNFLITFHPKTDKKLI